MATLPKILINPTSDSREGGIQLLDLLPSLDLNFKPHILSCGAGVDSLALLIHYCSISDEQRGFPLSNLVVVHAVVGSESATTKAVMEKAIFPLCRKHNIWFIQAHRNGELQGDGITVLQSTRQPYTFYLNGEYSLFYYTIMCGSPPQRGGSSRKCTLKFKGWVIDGLARLLFSDSPTYRFIGYNSDEKKRSKDKSWHSEFGPVYEIGYNADEIKRLHDKSFGNMQAYDDGIGFKADEQGRSHEAKERGHVFRFPLIELGFNREKCVQICSDFVTTETKGAITEIPKSFCRDNCPFPACNGKRKSGNNHGDLRIEWLLEPRYGGRAAFIDTICQAMNPFQPLFETTSVLDVLVDTRNEAAIAYYHELMAGNHWPEIIIPMLRRVSVKYPGAMAQADALAEGKTWAVYSVRRIFPENESPYRETNILLQDSREYCMTYLKELGDRYDMEPQLEQLSYRFHSIPRKLVHLKTPKGKFRYHKDSSPILGKPPLPFVEEQLVLAPATVYPKKRCTEAKFQLLWFEITGQSAHIRGNKEPECRPDVQLSINF